MSESPPELSGPDLTAGIALAELPDGHAFLGHAHGKALILVRRADDVAAFSATCTHFGAPLVDGIVTGDTLRCPWHHACFSLRSGEATAAPALDPLDAYAVRVEAGRVTVGERLTPRPPATPAISPSSVVLVGAGPASAAAAVTLRKLGYTGPVTLIGDEPPSPIDRTNLSKDFLAGSAPEDWVPIRPVDYWRDLDVGLTLDDPAASLQPERKTLTLASGRVVEYGALLLATGAEAIRLPIPGATLPHVFTLRSLADARSVIAASAHAKRAVVVGSSFIGLEVAASLRTRNLDVDVVGLERIPLSRILGEELGRFVRTLHEGHGVRFHAEVGTTSIDAAEVQLSNGERLPADLVVMGVGVRPRVALAERAGLRVGDGVIVDNLLRTSAPDVYAAGDVARYPEPRLGRMIRIEHFVVAQRQGQAAAAAMLGRGAPFRAVPFFWSQHYDLTISYVGHASSFESAELRGSLEGRDATVIYKGNGRVLAVATIGRDRQSLAVEAALEQGDQAALDGALA